MFVKPKIIWPTLSLPVIFFLKIYLFWRESGGGAEGEGQADSSPSKEPDVGLDPRTLRSRPKPKSDA